MKRLTWVLGVTLTLLAVGATRSSAAPSVVDDTARMAGCSAETAVECEEARTEKCCDTNPEVGTICHLDFKKKAV